MKIIIATIKSWNIENAKILKQNISSEDINVHIITQKEQLDFTSLKEYNPDYIFFPHWSWIIPKEIFSNFNCIVFHMTDLPFGRGGSPLQNLIVNGYKETKISAIKVEEGLDVGDIYIKEDLSLDGSAQDIYKRASDIIFKRMIPFILKNKPIPYKQTGEIVEFSRLKPKDGEILPSFSIEKIYDYIRMLDAEGYPNAFIQFGNYKLRFNKAYFNDNKITAAVEITKEESGT
ncbi:methionyl-tRNA formyltransferase [Ruminiclostridium herbifermentans]|uniref:Methionyl-tRNA formyltransferase n=1 Tax=Ruminiclostridium herbifermentans TaxID=2488810 RepID=A0A4U7JKR9_9FIRM|nr:formyltransferase family protein [Ruminiclostridium herbifermentans]QNU67122.1 methionyl-tRNA formyltransferase [Ruminiclostridium herbifermentans]